MVEKLEDVHKMTRARFSRIARDPSSEKKFPVGPESAKQLGYNPAEIDVLPSSVEKHYKHIVRFLTSFSSGA